MKADRTLHALLDAELAFAPEYEGSPARAVTRVAAPGDTALANHLPMALHALADLGADAALLLAWFEQAAARMPRLPAWPELEAAEERLPVLPAHELLAGLLPELLRHAGAAAFHALIRCAHAFESGHAGQLRRALAWWSLLRQPVPLTSARPALALEDWLDALLTLPAPPGPPGRLISHRMQQWIDHPPFAAWAPTLRLDASMLPRLARRTAALYAGSGNFTLLHGLTACRAMSRLLPLLAPSQHETALRAFSVHWAAAVCTSRFQAGEPPAPEPWEALLARTLQAEQDEHVIKLVHAARQFDRDGDPLWRMAATRAVLRH